MLQTEFNDGSGSKLVISWDASIDTNESAVETTRCDDLVEKVNQLYGTISAFSAEFVQCMRQIKCSKHDANSAREALNLSFKISDTSTEHSSDEISRLRSEVDRLQRENHQLETDLKCKVADITNLEKVHEQDKRQLRNKYQKDMSELRVYFEKICHDSYERDITSHLYNHKEDELRANSNPDDKAADHDYDGTSCISFNDVDYNGRKKSKGTISSDLKMFIVKAYETQVQQFKDDFNTKKDEEVEKLKEDNVKYSEMIETLQNEVNRLVREKIVENNVKEIHLEVRGEYETELEELQDISDKEFLRKMNNDKVTLEKEFKRKFENALNELNDEWEKKIEVLSELLVQSMIKSVNLEETYSKSNEEKKMLQLKLDECSKILSLDENGTNVEDIAAELVRLKNVYQYETDTLQTENALLRNKIEDLQQRIPPANSSREKVITMLIEEITDLIQKEQLGETVTWPTELAALENVFSRKLHPTQNLTPHQQNQSSPQFENNGTNEQLDNSLDLNQLLEERDGLRKVNITLKGVINMFTRYLTNCEEDCNSTLIEALINAEKHKKNLDTIGSETSTFDIDYNCTSIEDEVKSVKFLSNLSEFLSSLEENDRVNTSTLDGSISVTGNDLKSWLQIVRNEASHVLQLISNQKNDVNYEKKSNRNENVRTASSKTNYHDEAAQTDLFGQEIDKNEEKMVVLQHSLQKAENELRELQEKISFLEGFIDPTESLEGYGEANHSIGLPNYVLNTTGVCQNEELESDLTSEVYCAKCDDFQKQIRYVRNLLEQNKKHLERQALERDSERDEYDKHMKKIMEERDVHLSTKERFKCEATLLEQQVKELNGKLENNIEAKNSLETRVKTLEKQLRTLQEENVELKEAAAVRSESTTQAEKKIKIKEEELKTLQTDYQKLLDELDSLDEIRAKQVQEFSEAHVSNSYVCDKMKKELMEIERVVTSRTRILENSAVVFVPSSVLSSPSASISEDVSCDQHTRLFSPNGSDSSPGRNRISFDVLACLHDKLNKLFRAEDASFKKIRDQDMQLAKIMDEVKNVELERDTLNESLRITSDKLSQTKRELENWRIGGQQQQQQQHSLPYQSTVQLELTAKIRKLQSEIKHYKEYLTQKDDCDATYLRTVNSLQTIVSRLNFDEKDEMEENLRQLYARFEQLEQEKKIRQQQFAVLEEDSYETDGTPKRKRRLARCEAFTPADGKSDLRRSRGVSFAENLESYSPDSDVTRRAPTAVISPVPGITSPVVGHNSFSNNKIPRLNLNKSTSFFNAKSSNLRPNFDVEQLPIAEMKDSESYDSISLDSNAAAFGSSTDNNGEKSGPSEQDTSSAANESTPDKQRVQHLRDNLEREKKRHQLAFSTLRRLKNANALREDDELADLMANCDEIEDGSPRTKLNSSKELLSCDEAEKDDFGLRTLTREMRTSVTMMKQLEEKLRQVEHKLVDDVESYKKECQESKNVSQAVIKERIEIEKRYEELSKKIDELREQLGAEKSKSVELSAALESVRGEVANLRAALGNEKERVKTITRENENMKEELARANSAVAGEPGSKSSKAVPGAVEKGPESLRDLAEKVQREVELAGELDQHLLNNLKSTMLNNLSKVSSTLSPNLKRVLFKMLQEGCENLMPEDKKVLVESLDLLDATNIRCLEETNKELVDRIENLTNMINEQSLLSCEINRLETVLTFYEERITFLTSKIDDYRNRYVKSEIELTSARCTCTQLECQVLTLKKEGKVLKSELEIQVQKYENEKNCVMKENVDLKQKLDTLKNQIEALTAEMNSIKAISQYHSNSEAELSRSLYPLKSKLEDVQKKYSRMKVDLEIAVGETQKVKFDLNVERLHNRQLEERQKTILLAKNNVEEKLIEMKMKYDDLIWQKQKVDDKLRGFELLETRKHRLRMDGIRQTREENESAQRQLEDEYDRLKRNILKVKETFISLHYSWKKVCEKCQTLYHRTLRAEKNQRALVYQKNYFITRGYCESTLIPSPTRKFKSVVIAVMLLHRVEFLTRRRLEHGRQTMLKSFTDELPNVKVYPWFDFTTDLPEGINGSDLTNESETSIKDVEFVLINDSLKALHAQFQTLLNKRD